LCEVSNGAFSTGNNFRFIIFASTISDLNRCPAKTTYAGLQASQRFGEEDLDPAAPDRHIAVLSTSALLSGCAVSVFGLHRGEHVYESEFHRALFSDPQGGYAGGGSIPMTNTNMTRRYAKISEANISREMRRIGRVLTA